MTSRYSARIGVAAGDRAGAVLAAVEADARFHPDSGQEAAVRVLAGRAEAAGAAADGDAPPAPAGEIRIGIDADQLPHLRAGVGSTLRLVQAAYESIGAAAAAAPGAPPGGEEPRGAARRHPPDAAAAAARAHPPAAAGRRGARGAAAAGGRDI